MGLKFCNEAIISLKQIWPTTDEKEELSPLQAALMERLGASAYPFSLEVGTLAPPSVQLVPAKRYTGAPIGTSYDVRVHLGEFFFLSFNAPCVTIYFFEMENDANFLQLIKRRIDSIDDQWFDWVFGSFIKLHRKQRYSQLSNRVRTNFRNHYVCGYRRKR